MSSIEILRVLHSNVGKVIRVVFADGEILSLTVMSVDDEGFVHRVGEELFWSTFEDVVDIALPEAPE